MFHVHTKLKRLSFIASFSPGNVTKVEKILLNCPTPVLYCVQYAFNSPELRKFPGHAVLYGGHDDFTPLIYLSVEGLLE